MKIRKYIGAVAGAVLALLAVPAGAIPVTWTLQDVYVGGPTLPRVAITGSFIYDADLDLYSHVSLSSGDGRAYRCTVPGQRPCILATPEFPGVQYDFAANGAPQTTPTTLIAMDSSRSADGLTGDPLLFLRFADSLSNAGGNVDLAIGGVEYFCASEACTFDTQVNAFRKVLVGSVFDPILQQTFVYAGRVVAVPEPTTASLLALALVFLWASRRRAMESARR